MDVEQKNPDVKLKDSTTTTGKKILIDGQQRVTTLTAAILDHTVKNTDYEDVRIKIAFNPIERKFEMSNPAFQKDVTWIADVAPFLSGKLHQSVLRKEYCSLNPDMDDDEFDEILEGLKDIRKKEIGKKSPSDYPGYVANTQCHGGECKYGGITNSQMLAENMAGNCIPEATPTMALEDYPTFLAERRKLIAQRLNEYYFSL